MSLVLLSVGIFALSLAAGLAPTALRGRITASRLGDLTAVASGLLLAGALLVVIPEGFDIAAATDTADLSELLHDDHADEHAAEEHAAEEHSADEHSADGHSADEHGADEHSADEHGADEHSDHAGESHGGHDPFVRSPFVLGAAILAGFVLMLALEGLGVGHAVHEEHHDHEAGHGHGHVHHPTSMSALGIGLSVHALADGMAIGVAATVDDTAFSWLVAIAVLIHRLPAAFSLGVFALHETTSRQAALGAIGTFSLATPLAMLVSFALLDGAANEVLALVMLFSAGTFLYVATVDTLPSIHDPTTGRRSAILVLSGAALLSVLLWLANLSDLLEHSH